MSDRIEVVTTSWYDAEFETLALEGRARIENRLFTLCRKGWMDAMADRTVAALRDGIYELRVLGRGSAFRVLFFVVPGRSPRLVVLTSAVAKSTMKKRTRSDAELERAKRRRALWFEQMKLRTHDERR